MLIFQGYMEGGLINVCAIEGYNKLEWWTEMGDSETQRKVSDHIANTNWMECLYLQYMAGEQYKNFQEEGSKGANNRMH